MPTGILEIAIVFLAAAIFGVLAKLLRQPIVIAYLAAGLLIGYFGFFNLGDKETLRVFSDLGIMFLLFLVGLEVNYESFKVASRTAVFVGLGQIVFTFLAGFFIAFYLGFVPLHSAYIALALTFSSTIIIVKLLSDKKDLNSLYGRISVVMLLIEDFIAIIILIVLAGLDSTSGFSFGKLAVTILKGLGLFAVTFWLSRRFFPWLFNKIARSQELLYLLSSTWVFLFAAAVSELGFSIEIAGLLAGLALANSSEHFQIASRIRPLRDFFILVFFVILGSSLIVTNFSGLALPIVLLSLFVLLGNPLIILVIMGLMGYRKRTSFLTAITSSQLSEFSLIVAAVGLKLGHLTESVVALITAVGVTTIIISTYVIVHGERIFRTLSHFLRFFEKRQPKEDSLEVKTFHKPIILAGLGRTGASIAFNLPREKLLVIEFDPGVVESLKRHGFDYLFGDITDLEIFARANFEEAQLAISTSPDFEDNMLLLEALLKLPRRPRMVFRAETEAEARKLYERGADYVLMPQFTSGQYLGKTITIDPEMKILDSLREKDLALMRQVKSAF